MSLRSYMSWKRMLARSRALEASERSIAVSMVGGRVYLLD